MTFFYDLNKKLADIAKPVEQTKPVEQPKPISESTGDYSAKKAHAGKDIGKPGKNFAKIAKGAAQRYGSKAAGERVAGAVLAKLRKGVGEAAKPDYLDLDGDGNKIEPMKAAAKQAKGKGMAEGDMEEGNKFAHNVLKAKAAGVKKADLDGDGDLEAVKEIKLADLPVRLVKGKKYGGSDQPEEPDVDDEFEPNRVGRPKGAGKKLGAKVKGTSKLSRLGAIAEDLPPGADEADTGEYGMEGDQAKDDIHTIVRHAKQLEKILSDEEDLPEWVQGKLTKIQAMMTSVNDYMQTQHERAAEKSSGRGRMEIELDEKAVSKSQQRFMGMVHAAQKGEKPASKEVAKVAKTMKKSDAEDFAKTKHKGLPEKKKKEVEETTTAGAVATAPAEAPKSKKGGVQFGKGIYDSMSRDLEQMIAESISVNISTSTEGSPSVSVSATDEDAAKLAQILKAAGIGSSMGAADSTACPACGGSPCGCAEKVDENQPDWPTNTEQSDDALQYSGGLNKPKTTVAGDGQTTVPVTAVQVREDEEQLDESTCTECGMYESRCECDKEEDMDESIRRTQNLAGIQEAKPDFLDIDKDGDRKESMKKERIMAKFKLTIVVEMDATNIDEAQDLAFDFVQRGNDSYVGEVITRRVEEINDGKFKLTIVVVMDATDIDEAQDLAFDFVQRGNASYDGEVGEVITRRVEEITTGKASDESIRRMQNLAGIQEAKPDFLDIDKDGDKKEPMKKAADEKDDEKVEESILNMRRLWTAYKA